MQRMILWGPGSSLWLATARLVCVEKDIAHFWEEPVGPEGDILQIARYLVTQSPSLRDGQFSLFTGEAIVRYLDDAFPGPSLMPPYARGRALASEMLAVIRDYIMEAAIGALFLQQYILPRFQIEPNSEVCAQANIVVKDALLVLEQLSLLAHDGEKSEYLLGIDITLPDLLLIPVFYYLDQIEEGRNLIQAHPRLARWWLEAQKRHSLELIQPALLSPAFGH